MNTISATNARNHFFEVIKNTVKKHEIQYIQYKDKNVVLLSSDDYENLQETLELLSIDGFKDKLVSSVQDVKEKKPFLLTTFLKGFILYKVEN